MSEHELRQALTAEAARLREARADIDRRLASIGVLLGGAAQAAPSPAKEPAPAKPRRTARRGRTCPRKSHLDIIGDAAAFARAGANCHAIYEALRPQWPALTYSASLEHLQRATREGLLRRVRDGVYADPRK